MSNTNSNTENLILEALKRLEVKVDKMNESLSMTREEMSAYKSQLNNVNDSITDLYSLHKDCSKERCEKYNQINEIAKKVGTAELLWKIVVGAGAAIVIVLSILKFFGIGV